MILCSPRGVCSWDFELTGDGHHAAAEFNWAGEQGSLRIDSDSYRILKHGMFSGRWTMNGSEGDQFDARKTSAFTRTFEISGQQGLAVLSARSAMGRGMKLEGRGIDCLIEPAHAFTRRASITGSYDDFKLVVFGFWLTVLTWRRNASNAAAASA